MHFRGLIPIVAEPCNLARLNDVLGRDGRSLEIGQTLDAMLHRLWLTAQVRPLALRPTAA